MWCRRHEKSYGRPGHHGASIPGGFLTARSRRWQAARTMRPGPRTALRAAEHARARDGADPAGEQDSILHHVVNAVESLGSCTTEGIFLDGRWQDRLRIPGRKAASLPAVVTEAEGGPGRAGGSRWPSAVVVGLLAVQPSRADRLSGRRGSGSAAESERFLLRGCWPSRRGWPWPMRACTAGSRNRPGSLRLANFALCAAWRFTSG